MIAALFAFPKGQGTMGDTTPTRWDQADLYDDGQGQWVVVTRYEPTPGAPIVHAYRTAGLNAARSLRRRMLEANRAERFDAHVCKVL